MFSLTACGGGGGGSSRSVLTYKVGGVVNGLVGSGLSLQNNGESLPINSDGSFVFGTSLSEGESYAVSVMTQPDNPQQVCTIIQGAGLVQTQDITNIEVNCLTGQFTVGGTVSGLVGSGLILQNKGGNDLTVSGNGSFTLNAAFGSGETYLVTVLTHPSAPAQTCSVFNGSGSVSNANVSNVAISCNTGSSTVGGTVSGLSGTGLVLQNNGGNNISISANGSFTFSALIANGNNYNVSILTHPNSPTQLCSVSNASGTISGGSVSDVAVICATESYTLGGTVSGLSASGLVLQNNNGDDLPVAANGAFIFSTPLVDGGIYSATVLVHPTAQFCSVSNGSGTFNGANVNNISINCVSGATYSVGGLVSGIAAPGPGLVLQNNGGDNLTINDNGSFTFNTLLSDGAGYNVTLKTPSSTPNVGCSVSKGSGSISSANVSDVVVTCLQYDGAQKIENEVGSTGTPVLVSDSLGHVTVVWPQQDGANLNLWSTRFTIGIGWDANATKIDTEDLGPVEGVIVLIDNPGNVTVIWVQSEGIRSNLWARRFEVGTGWGGAQKIETGDGTVLPRGGFAGPEAVIDASSGEVTVVWSQKVSGGTVWNQWSNRYSGGGWGTAEMIEVGAGDLTGPSLVIDPLGNVTAIWGQLVSGGSLLDLWANRYDVVNGAWGAAQKIDTADDGNVKKPVIVSDHLGNLTVVWPQFDGAWDNQWSNRYTMGSGWGTAEKIEIEDAGNVFAAKLVVDASGHVMAVWKQNDSIRDSQRANRYTLGLGWGDAQKIETEDVGSVEDAVLVVDDFGNVTAVWTQFDNSPRKNLWANRYTAGTGVWNTAAEKIESDDSGDVVGTHSVLIDSLGNLTALWTQSDGAQNNIWANRYLITTGVWGAAEKIDTEDLGGGVLSNAFSAGLDATGNVTVVWIQNNGSLWNKWVNRYVVGAGWDTAEKMDTEDLGNVALGKLVVDGFGRVTAVWSQFTSADNRYNLWSNRID